MTPHCPHTFSMRVSDAIPTVPTRLRCGPARMKARTDLSPLTLIEIDETGASKLTGPFQSAINNATRRADTWKISTTSLSPSRRGGASFAPHSGVGADRHRLLAPRPPPRPRGGRRPSPLEAGAASKTTLTHGRGPCQRPAGELPCGRPSGRHVMFDHPTPPRQVGVRCKGWERVRPGLRHQRVTA